MPDLIERLIGHRSSVQPLNEDRELERFFTDAERALSTLFRDPLDDAYPV